ncbi:hypothetical protein C9890_0218 [Perkinsus sp. BL_2016]|nr:hypothetical protein C9890_0218 [Perkinsus sp. BL_2016]
MEGIYRLIDTLKLTFNAEITKYSTEIRQLKEEVERLQRALEQKDVHCRHIATVLKSKNAEWKRIKETLTSSRQRSRQEIESVEINKDTINASYVTYDSCDTCDTYDACDDSTQLPSHLDTLVSLISDDSEFDEEDTEEVIICVDTEKENGDIKPAASVSVFEDHKMPQKRKTTRSPQTTEQADSFHISANTPPGFWDTAFTPRQ